MNGLSYYGIGQYKVDSSINRSEKEIAAIVKSMNDTKEETNTKSTLIIEKIRNALKDIGIELHRNIDLSSNSVTLFNTGSTGRYTNLPGDGDFDFIMQVDRDIFENEQKKTKLRNAIVTSLGGTYDTVNGDVRELKTKVVDENGKEYEVEIDITFVNKTDKTEYASDVCVSDRLNNIKDEDERQKVMANIILTKQFLKGINAYKPARKDENQGGLGGIGVENWILQNGGTLYSAAKSFMKAAQECDTFEEFLAKYSLPNFGINHMAEKRGHYPHDDYVTNMNANGYKKMKESLSKYIELYEEQVENPVFETLKTVKEIEKEETFVYATSYQDMNQLELDTKQILEATLKVSDIKIDKANMGETGTMYKIKIDEKEYLVKPGVNKHDGKVRPARAVVQEIASNIQQLISPDRAVIAKTYGTGNVKVAVQEKIDNAKTASETELITQHTTELIEEYVVDYLLGNFDSDAQNFVIDSNGVAKGIDKEQSLKYLLTDEKKESLKLDFSYDPKGARTSIYSGLFRYINEKGLSNECLDKLLKSKEKVGTISDEKYIEIFKQYAYSYDATRSKEILDKILERKNYFLEHIDEFIMELSGKELKTNTR